MFKAIEKAEPKAGSYTVRGVPQELLDEMKEVEQEVRKLGYQLDFSKKAITLFKRTVTNARKDIETASAKAS